MTKKKYLLEVKKMGKTIISGVYTSRKEVMADMVAIAYYGHTCVSVKTIR